MAQGDNVPDLAAGNQVVLRTIFGEEISSTIIAFDQQTNTLLLKEPGAHNGVATIRLLKVDSIKEIVSAERPKEPFDMTLPHVDLEKCKKREERALQQAEMEASRVGEGVTKEAQAIFDALFKTMPCRWQNKTIVVLEEVHVGEPYTPEAATSDAAHKSTLQRVQKVLSAERMRLGI